MIKFSIQSFSDVGSEDIFRGINSKRARKSLPVGLHKAARRKLHILDKARDLHDLQRIPGNRFEKLKGDKGFSIRINQQYRIIFNWADKGPEMVLISKHYE